MENRSGGWRRAASAFPNDDPRSRNLENGAARRTDTLLVRGAVLTLLIGCAAACASTTDAPVAGVGSESAGARVEVGLDNLNAVLWVQTAVEYRATALQAFQLGRRVLDEALDDPSWTAVPEQVGDVAGLPPAIILDIDETVLDNSFFEARLTLDKEVYSEALWDEWAMQQASTAIPGALGFLRYAVERGVTVFYVSNRRAHLEVATRANLEALGFPVSDDVDTLLLRGEIPAWEGSDKTPRWRSVASVYRVLLMFGDNMGDFSAAASGTVAARLAFAAQHEEYWGSRWITLANPTYGSFIGAVLDNDYRMSQEQQVELKKRALDPRRR